MLRAVGSRIAPAPLTSRIPHAVEEEEEVYVVGTGHVLESLSHGIDEVD